MTPITPITQATAHSDIECATCATYEMCYYHLGLKSLDLLPPFLFLQRWEQPVQHPDGWEVNHNIIARYSFRRVL
jgi:hypothetical protein